MTQKKQVSRLRMYARLSGFSHRGADAFASEFSKCYRESERISLQQICDAFAGYRRLLEIGTGSGVDANRFIQAGLDYTGLEPSLGLVANGIPHFQYQPGCIFALRVARQGYQSWKREQACRQWTPQCADLLRCRKNRREVD